MGNGISHSVCTKRKRRGAYLYCAKVYDVCVECERVNICMVNSFETFSMISGVHNSAACVYLENEEDVTL